MLRGLLWGNRRKRDHLEKPGVDGRILKMDLQDVVWGAWTGLIWLRWRDHVNAVMYCSFFSFG